MAPLLPLLLPLPVLLLLAAADAFPASCSNASCAGHDIHYPFWLNSSGSDNCGYPGLGLVCENNATNLILSVQSHRYKVIDINYDKHTLAVSDADPDLDEYGSGCPRLRWNLTIDYSSSWLQLTSSDSNITFLYNCKKNISLSSAVELGCQGGYASKRSYVLRDGVATTDTLAYEHECEEVVVAPVMTAHKVGMIAPPPLGNGSSYGEVVKAGFEFTYNPNSQPCSRCERSGGWCGYRPNHSNGDLTFTCFCDSGPTSHRCGAYSLLFLVPPHYFTLVSC